MAHDCMAILCQQVRTGWVLRRCVLGQDGASAASAGSLSSTLSVHTRGFAQCCCKGHLVVRVRRYVCYAMKAADACASAVGDALAQKAPTQLARRSRLPACTSMHGSAVQLCLIGAACHRMQGYEAISCGSLAAWQLPLTVDPCWGIGWVCMVLIITQCAICFTSKVSGRTYCAAGAAAAVQL